jgi:hypothetical protein
MSKQKAPSNWIPEILYEENQDGISSNIPFIQVPEGEEMPKVIFIFETRETGDFEPGPEGEEMPVMDMDLHQYADMAALKNNLPLEIYDQVRGALGLLPLKDAVAKGSKITQNIRNKVTSN